MSEDYCTVVLFVLCVCIWSVMGSGNSMKLYVGKWPLCKLVGCPVGPTVHTGASLTIGYCILGSELLPMSMLIAYVLLMKGIVP